MALNVFQAVNVPTAYIIAPMQMFPQVRLFKCLRTAGVIWYGIKPPVEEVELDTSVQTVTSEKDKARVSYNLFAGRFDNLEKSYTLKVNIPFKIWGFDSFDCRFAHLFHCLVLVYPGCPV